MIPSFDYSHFISIYPMYSTNPSQAVLTNLWNDVDALGTPIVSTLVPTKQEYYYYVVEAHLAELWIRGAGVTGILTNTNQDSVSIALYTSKNEALLFWNQTAWGQKIAQLIQMRGTFTFIFGGNNYYNIYN